MRGWVLLMALAICAPANAHDQWADGSEVPSWVKSACCGPADAHLLKNDDVWVEGGEYHVRGNRYTVPVNKALPSPDGRFWIFYGTYWGDYGSREKYDGMPICFFAPTGA